jgi:hypothetical protein
VHHFFYVAYFLISRYYDQTIAQSQRFTNKSTKIENILKRIVPEKKEDAILRGIKVAFTDSYKNTL